MWVAEAGDHETALPLPPLLLLLLLEWDAAIEVMDEDGWTPLIRAAGEGREMVIKLLLGWGSR
jgi:ankyrin repeat protein